MKNIKIYKACNTLSVYRFCMVLQEKDLRYLIKGFDETTPEKFEEHRESIHLADIFDDIAREYRELINDNFEKKKRKAEVEIDLLKMKYSLVVDLLDLYATCEMIEVLGCFEELGYKFDLAEPIGPQLDNITKKMIGLKNTIKIKEAQYKNKYLKDVKEDEQITNMIHDLDASALALEADLEKGYRIDVRKTSLLRWANLHNMREAKIKAHKNNMAKWQRPK